MYELGPAFENRSVRPGRNILVSGPPLSGIREVALDSLACGLDRGEGALVITTRYSADWMLEELGNRTRAEGTIGIVDSVTRQHGRSPSADSLVRYVDSPADLTGMGTEFAALLDALRGEGLDGIRVLVDSLSTLIPYTGVQPVCQFTAVLADQVADIDGLGLYLVESTAHDPTTRSTIDHLFEAQVAVESGTVVDLMLPGTDTEDS